MFIIPINNSISPLNLFPETKAPIAQEKIAGGTVPFADVLGSVLQNQQSAAVQSEADSYSSVLGQLDDLHNIPIQSSVAQVTLQTFVNIKNTAVDAFNELMRMNL